jgi:hypothetical protein
MIAGKAAGVIDDLAAHAAQTVFLEGLPAQPDPHKHRFYGPLVEKYIHMENMLEKFFV